MQIKPFVASVLLSFFALSASAYSIWPVPRTVTNKQESLDISSQITVVADEGVDQLTIRELNRSLKKQESTTLFPLPPHKAPTST